MLETFTKWFYLIGSIALTISILTYFLYKAKTLRLNFEYQDEVYKFFGALFGLIFINGVNVIGSIIIFLLPNPNSGIASDVLFLIVIIALSICCFAFSVFEIIDSYIKNVTEIRQNRLMRQSIKI